MILSIIKKLRITQRMIFFFQIMIIPMVFLFILFLFITNKLHDIETKIMFENVASIRATYNVEKSLLRLRRLNTSYILQPSDRLLEDFNRNVDEFNKWYNEAFRKSIGNDERDILSNIAINFSKYQQCHQEIVRLTREKKESRAIHLMRNDGNRYYQAIYNNCEKLIKTNDTDITQSEATARTYLHYSRIIGYMTIAVFLIGGFMLLMIISHSIVDPIRQIEKESGLAISDKKGNELERLKAHFNNMLKKFHESQARLVRNEKRAAIGEISAGISHELNNPIGIISGFAEMLINSKSMHNKDLALAREIFRESQRCRSLLGDLLNFARSPEPKMKRTNIVRIVKQTIQTYSSQDRYKNVLFECRADNSTINARIDHMQIQQVFINLINNACDAMKYKGKCIITIIHNRSEVILKFADTGHGIKAEDQNKIFTPFFSTKKKGTGLGLAISHDIIDRHNGELYFTSSRKGTEFEIRLVKGSYGKRHVQV